MIKPTPRIPLPAVLHYTECRDYIEHTYNIQTRDYKRRFSGDDNTVPYCDFWHWVLDRNDNCTNGSMISFYVDVVEELGEVAEDWVKEILKMFKTEFAEYVDSDGQLWFWVEW